MSRSCAATMIAAASAMGCATDAAAPTDHSAAPNVGGAGYVTYDAVEGGCRNADAIHCNTYASTNHVFISGGPSAGLADGTYFFAVLAPGSQLASFLDDADTNGVVGNRLFTVEDHEITSYDGTHATGQTPDGRFAIGLAPFDDIDNPSGIYVLAICAAGAIDPSECTYDSFRIRADLASEPAAQLPILHGGAYYDANLDGAWDISEPGLPSWPIDYHDMISGTVETGADGAFTLELIPDGYLLIARQPQGGGWLPARAPVDQTRTEGAASASLNADSSYWIEVDDDQVVHGVAFGYVCVGPDGDVRPTPADCAAPVF